MLVSFRWLGRHVDLDGLTAQDIAQDLTTHTAEVEGIERFAPWLSRWLGRRLGERALPTGGAD